MREHKQVQYKVRFVTPAFLGGPDQSGQWRTPPFKALLRQWWRVASAKGMGYDHRKLREEEGVLFGHAWLEHRSANGKRQSWSMRSRIRLRLDRWEPGRLREKDWPGGKLERVTTTRDGKGQVPAHVYLGFGPVGLKEELVHPPALAPDGDRARLRLSGSVDVGVERAIRLVHWFGALGGRSRNGWGSLLLEGPGVLPAPPDAAAETLEQVLRPWTECLGLDWPHAIGADGRGPLVWIAEPRKDWREAMSLLAHLKVSLRFEAKKKSDRSGIGGIHLLGYPAGKAWQIRNLGNDARLAGQLRFKVIEEGQGPRGLIFHLPARFPETLRERLDSGQRRWLERNERAVWEGIHRHLDGEARLKRLGG